MVSASPLLLTCDLENAIAPPWLTVAPTTLVTDAIALLGTSPISPPVAANQDALNVPNSSGCAHCLVVMDDAQLVGLFSERDVTRLVAEEQSLTGVPLAEVVEPPVVTIRQVELTTPDAALKLLQQHDIQHLPVLDDNGQVVGLLTGESLCRLLQPVELDQQPEQSLVSLFFRHWQEKTQQARQ
ncbi:MAG TPA: CBS domain-containing protein [Coleofasciculaceae cyanobacterium]|jgi:CBS domain-containing protein